MAVGFTISFIIWIGTTGLYIITDQLSSWIHHPYYEFRIWVTLISLLINMILFYFTRVLSGYSLTEDKSRTFLSSLLFAIFVSLLIVPSVSASFVNLWLRSSLNKYQFKKARDDLEFSITMSDLVSEQKFTVIEKNKKALKKARKIEKVLKSLAEGPTLGVILSLLSNKEKKKRAQIFKVLSSCNSAELNVVLLNVNLPKLFTYGLYFSKQNSLNTIKYIIDKRDGELTTFSRASVIHALMRTSTLTFSLVQANWAVKSFSGCLGEELTLLKCLIDSSGDYNNLYKLVFVDMPNEKQRKQLLRHILRQAREILKLDQATGKRRVKILSDVDDTLYSSGGRFPAGSDDRLPRHAVYPGVLQLFDEIDSFAYSSGVVPDMELRKSVKFDNVNFLDDNETNNVEEDLQTLMHEELEKFLEANTFSESAIERNNRSVSIVGKSTQTMKLLDPQYSNKLKITVKIPWRSGSSEQLVCDSDIDFKELTERISTLFGIPPWKQDVTVEPFNDNLYHFNHGNLAFLSARPNVYKDISERQSYTIFQQLNSEGLLHTTPTLLTGSLSSGLEAMLLRYRDTFFYRLDKFATKLQNIFRLSRRGKQAVGIVEEGRKLITNHNWLSVAKTKVEKFKKYSLLYPEYRFVFFGDDGQGDLYASEKLMKYFKKFQFKSERRLIKCLMHRCYRKNRTSIRFSSLQEPEDTDWEKMGIVFFDTYIGAAIHCFDNNLISGIGLWRVASRAIEETRKLVEEHSDHDFSLFLEQLTRDLDEVNALCASLNLDVPELPLFDTERN